MLYCVVLKVSRVFPTLACFLSFFVSIAAIRFCHNASILTAFSAVVDMVCLLRDYVMACVRGREWRLERVCYGICQREGTCPGANVGNGFTVCGWREAGGRKENVYLLVLHTLFFQSHQCQQLHPRLGSERKGCRSWNYMAAHFSILL